ncbi:hypothetical protein CANARDRAFT_10026 [[Candida] arabinofermentans NRRL YB-2248]|uniref:Beta-lactamase-related domain-containing protein n=1 Tax=[Candida] arabinofermentans NRRL YB-2248 TaxID=983967 RepID=A0A1E4STU6_9ASCO|nr:hypothetical protein CANARDRAFT_10026 [[Candida] arabinofermentans NRRL YB-2248]
MAIIEGRWVGSAPEYSFEQYAEIDIIKESDHYTLTLWDRKVEEIVPKKITLLSANSFEVTTPHWIMNTQVELSGVFISDDQLELTVKKDGMTGLDSYTAIMKKVSKEAAETFDFSAKYEYKTPEIDSELLFPATDSEETGIPHEKLEHVVNSLKTLNGRYDDPNTGRIEGLLILKDNKLILEEYFGRFTAESQHATASCVKSIIAILYGVLYDQGKSKLDEILTDAFKDVNCTWAKPATVENVLNMSTGSEFGLDESRILLETDKVAKLVLGAPQVADPGSVFNYDNGLPCVLAQYIELKSGLGIREFAKKYLFDPLNITDYHWSDMREKSIDGTILPLAAGGFYMTMKDMAKIGSLIINDGCYGDKRIISTEYLKIMISNHSGKDQYPYGFYWHIDCLHGKFQAPLALGQGGQIIAALAEQNMVVVMFSSLWQCPFTDPSQPAPWKQFAEEFLEKL